MQNYEQAKAIVAAIRAQIESSRDTRIWVDYVNALKLISQVVFTRSSGFILELMQNAEDSGLGLCNSGEFQISVSSERVKISHNGKLFSEDDVKALCGIRSSKKPEKGTLGYLGIGFKSVFKVTDRPEVYSGGFQFKFDRAHKEWGNASATPWHVLPIWIDQPSEAIDPDVTTFVIPFREQEKEAICKNLTQELASFRTELYLFLHWMKKIRIANEITGHAWTLENEGEAADNITTLLHSGYPQRFRFFRRTCRVPDWVKEDRLTQEYRANVAEREIVVAFALDTDGNLAPTQAGAMYGGVYSFLPLGEAKSGAKFPIQADFLVQPGRDAVNYEAKWNQWIVAEAQNLCKDAIECFKNHAVWKYQFLPAFEFTKSKGLESYDKLFGPKLIEPLEQFLALDACVPTVDGGWARPDQSVIVSEDDDACDELVTMGILGVDQIAPVLGECPNLKQVASRVKERSTQPFRRVDRRNLLKNKDYLTQKAKQPDAPTWFQSLYDWLQRHPVWNVYHQYSNYRASRKEYHSRWLPLDGRTYKATIEGYHDFQFILASDLQVLKGGALWIAELPPSDPMIKDLADTLQKTRPVLHPNILEAVKDEAKRKAIVGFLRGYCGVQLLDRSAVCREALLPRILTDAPKPPPADLLRYSAYCQDILGEEVPQDSEFWVLTRAGDVRVAKETLLSTEFQPEHDWETNQKYVPGLNFVSPDYLLSAKGVSQPQSWGRFLMAGGVRQDPDSGVEVFAMNFAQEKLGTVYTNVTPVEKLNFGFDLKALTNSGGQVCIEVKGSTKDQDIELTSAETETADKYGDDYLLCVVSSVPKSPNVYLVRNPANVVKICKITLPIRIPPEVWKKAKCP
ncbi:MAG: DUF3883 domain-containing protein [Chloroflexi bacterium]|nr:DUF3883 domain-containing protein [Chloroflexota bacterium]